MTKRELQIPHPQLSNMFYVMSLYSSLQVLQSRALKSHPPPTFTILLYPTTYQPILLALTVKQIQRMIIPHYPHFYIMVKPTIIFHRQYGNSHLIVLTFYLSLRIYSSHVPRITLWKQKSEQVKDFQWSTNPSFVVVDWNIEHSSSCFPPPTVGKVYFHHLLIWGLAMWLALAYRMFIGCEQAWGLQSAWMVRLSSCTLVFYLEKRFGGSFSSSAWAPE